MSYDPKVFELGWDFIMAGERYRVLYRERVPSEEKVEMACLFEQLTFGDIDITCANAQDVVLSNCCALEACKVMTKVDAIKRYVTKADQLVETYK